VHRFRRICLQGASTGIGIHRNPLDYTYESATLSYLVTYTMTLTPALQEALNDAISSGNFIDTKVVLYSRRDSSGRVCKPKALYANSHVLKSVPYFNDREFSPCSLHGV